MELSRRDLYFTNAITFGSLFPFTTRGIHQPEYPPKKVKEGPLPDYKVKNHRRKKGK